MLLVRIACGEPCLVVRGAAPHVRLDGGASRAEQRLLQGEVDGEPRVHVLCVSLRMNAQGDLSIPAANAACPSEPKLHLLCSRHRGTGRVTWEAFNAQQHGRAPQYLMRIGFALVLSQLSRRPDVNADCESLHG